MDRKATEILSQALDITIKVDPENAEIVEIKSYLSTHSTDEPPQTSDHTTKQSSSQSEQNHATPLPKQGILTNISDPTEDIPSLPYQDLSNNK